MGNITDLYTKEKQSPWLDNLRRNWLGSGELQKWLDRGVRGITSNPSIFAKAMSDTNDYDEALEELVKSGASIDEAYWGLVVEDIREAATLLHPLFQKSEKEDGYISVEVSPFLAHKEQETVDAALDLKKRIAADNVYIKVPATTEGVSAIQTIIAKNCSVNVTLIFSHSRYKEVMEAYISGLEDLPADQDLSGLSSVASFFISRIDVAVDKQLEALGTEKAKSLLGKAAVAQGQLAYKLYTETFTGERWEKLAARGARAQRPLWASTSTKNPSYPDTLYVDTLIGPDTVNTLPDATILAFDDHGTVSRTVDADFESAQQVLDDLLSLGIDLEKVGIQLEKEGVDSFNTSFDAVLATLGERASEYSPS